MRTTGRVVPDENAIYRIMAGADGLIRSLGDNAPGTLVKRDEVLATFFTSELRTAEQTYVFALQTRDRAHGSSSDMTSYGVKESFRLADQHLRQESFRLTTLLQGNAWMVADEAPSEVAAGTPVRVHGWGHFDPVRLAVGGGASDGG